MKAEKFKELAMYSIWSDVTGYSTNPGKWNQGVNSLKRRAELEAVATSMVLESFPHLAEFVATPKMHAIKMLPMYQSSLAVHVQINGNFYHVIYENKDHSVRMDGTIEGKWISIVKEYE